MDFEEVMTDGNSTRYAYANGTAQFNAMVEHLRAQFSVVGDPQMWNSVSSAQRNEIFDDEVVSAFFVTAPTYLTEIGAVSASRKFFLSKGWVYDKAYFFQPPGSSPLPMPDGAKAFGIGKLISVYGQPGEDDLSQYQCLYFMHTDHAAVEAWAGRSLPQGKYSTFYGATFDTTPDVRLMRVKTYTYDQQTAYSDWDVAWLTLCKSKGLLGGVK